MELAVSKESIPSQLQSNLSIILQPDETKRNLYIKPTGGVPGNVLVHIRKLVGEKIKMNASLVSVILKLIGIACFCVYIILLLKTFVSTEAPIDWRFGYGKAFIYLAILLWCVLYYKVLKQHLVKIFGLIAQTPLFLKYKQYIRYTICAILTIIILAFILIDSYNYPRRLISLFGIFCFLLISFIFSKHPDFVRWDIVISGILLHILLGILTIRWDTGRNIIEGLAENIVTFLNYGEEGALFVYGNSLINELMVFAFQALSTLYFLSMIARILYYFGWLQKFCFKIGGFIEFVLGTTVIESVYASTVIFLGLSEAPLLYAPYIELLTASEMHSIMAAGHSTVAGTLFAAYARMGIDPRYVVTASAMAAPASLCFSKLLYPETTPSRTSSESIEELKSEDSSIVDAACKGASAATFIVLGIIASVIACIGFVAFANGTFSWLGMLIGIHGLTLEWLIGQLFVPIAWLMGVIPEECQAVGSLIGIKTVTNEFVAYQHLGQLKRDGKISARSEAIATFALCAFSNPSALGTNIATLVALAPNRAESINRVALRAFVTGCITTFTSACIAGLLTEEEGIRLLGSSNATLSTM